MTTTNQFIARALIIGGIAFAGGVAHHSMGSATSLHDQLVQQTSTEAASVPKKLNDDKTTLTRVVVDGLQVNYIYTTAFNSLAADNQATLTQEVCSDTAMHTAILKGASFRYIYWNRNGAQLVADIIVSSCNPTT